MAADLMKLLLEAKTYLWALRFSQTPGLTDKKLEEIKATLAGEGIDVGTLVSLKQLEPSIARAPYPAVQSAVYDDYYYVYYDDYY